MSGPSTPQGYDEIAKQLRKYIKEHRYEDKLPTQKQLAEQYDVNLQTIRRAIDVLAREGLVEPIRRRGTMIRREPEPQYRLGVGRYAKQLWKYGETPAFVADRRAAGQAWKPGDQTQQVRIVSASDDLAEAFEVAPGTKLWERARLVTKDGAPTHTLTSYYLPEHVDGTPLVTNVRPGPSARGGGFQVLTLAGHEPDHIAERLFARMPNPDEVATLELPWGEPVIVLERRTYTASGELVEFARGVHRASQFVWEYKFPIPDEPDERLLAHTLWDYLVLGEDVPSAADVVVALGSHDARVAVRAAELMREGRYDRLVVSGGFGKVTIETNTEAEAEVFKRIAVRRGVDPDNIIVEAQSSSLIENIAKTRALLGDLGIAPTSGLLVCKPYMERRSLATAERQWPDVDWSVTSPDLTVETSPTTAVPFATMVALMVGEVQRLEVYAKHGLLTPQEIPPSVASSRDRLVELGFDRFLIASEPDAASG